MKSGVLAHERLFLDSSALLKRYVPETGTRWLRSLMRPSSQHQFLVSQITPTEIVSGVMRRQREGKFTPHAAHKIRLLVDLHMQRDYYSISISFAVSQLSEDLLEQYPLRGYDSIQLATALAVQQSLSQVGLPPLTFLSADQRLLTIAAQEGLLTDDPNLHP